MAPPADDPIGALWYRGVLKDECSSAPQNAQSAQDTVNYAVVLPPSAPQSVIKVSIDDHVLGSFPAQGGLNYGAVPGLAEGTPRLDLVGSDGSVAWSALGVNRVQSGNVPCNFNFNVAQLVSGN